LRLDEEKRIPPSVAILKEGARSPADKLPADKFVLPPAMDRSQALLTNWI